MIIDFNTARSLELVQNMEDPKSPNCLFGILNNTSTPMGARLLRASILQPSTDIPGINKRLDAVEELTMNEDTFFGIGNALKSTMDLDRLLSAVILYNSRKERNLIEEAHHSTDKSIDKTF